MGSVEATTVGVVRRLVERPRETRPARDGLEMGGRSKLPATAADRFAKEAEGLGRLIAEERSEHFREAIGEARGIGTGRSPRPGW